MLRIQSDNGQTLQLESDLSVEIELNSWLLSDSDDLPGSFSYPISFPLSDQNKKFLGFNHLPETRATDKKVSVWVNGIMLRQSTLSYKKEKNGASGFLKIDAGEIASKVRGRYLHEIFTETYYFGSSIANLRLLMKAAASAAPGTYPFTFFPVYNLSFSPETKDMEKFPSYRKFNFMNDWDGVNFLASNDRHVVPFLYLTHVIEKVCAFFGFKSTGSFLQHPEVQCLTIFNTQTLPLALNDLVPGINANLGMHLPYMTISDFLKALRDDFGLGVFFDTSKQECSFELYDHLRDRSSGIKDLSPFLLKGYDNELPDEKGYSLISYQDDQDLYYKSYEPVTYKLREGQKEIKASIGTLRMQRSQTEITAPRDWYVPICSQKGNLDSAIFTDTEYFNRSYKHKNPFGLRLLSYRGMQPDHDDVIYPFGSSISRRSDQTSVGTWSLDARQKDSIFYKFTIPFYTFLAYARRIRYNFRMPVSLAPYLKLQDVYGIRGENRVLVKGLLDRLSLNVPGENGSVLVKASMLLLLSPDPTPSIFLGELFYVELYKTDEYLSIEGDREIMYANYTIKVWADAGKTVPANPTNLVIHYIAYIYSTPAGQSTVPSQDNRSLTMSGHQTDLTNLIISDQSAAENIIIDYGIGTSADYIVL